MPIHIPSDNNIINSVEKRSNGISLRVLSAAKSTDDADYEYSGTFDPFFIGIQQKLFYYSLRIINTSFISYADVEKEKKTKVDTAKATTTEEDYDYDYSEEAKPTDPKSKSNPTTAAAAAEETKKENPPVKTEKKDATVEDYDYDYSEEEQQQQGEKKEQIATPVTKKETTSKPTKETVDEEPTAIEKKGQQQEPLIEEKKTADSAATDEGDYDYDEDYEDAPSKSADATTKEAASTKEKDVNQKKAESAAVEDDSEEVIEQEEASQEIKQEKKPSVDILEEEEQQESIDDDVEQEKPSVDADNTAADAKDQSEPDEIAEGEHEAESRNPIDLTKGADEEAIIETHTVSAKASDNTVDDVDDSVEEGLILGISATTLTAIAAVTAMAGGAYVFAKSRRNAYISSDIASQPRYIPVGQQQQQQQRKDGDEWNRDDKWESKW